MQYNPDNRPIVSAAPDEETEIDLLGLIYRLLDKWRLIVKVGIILAVIALLYGGVSGALDIKNAFDEAEYSAVSKIYVTNTNSYNIETGLEDFQFNSYLLADCREIIRNRQVREEADKRLIELGYGTPAEPEVKAPDEAAEKTADDEDAEPEIIIEGTVNVALSGNSRVIYITATAESTVMAMDMANTYADVAVEFIPQLMPDMKTTVFEYAEEPEDELSRLRLALNALIGMLKMAILGFVGGAFVVCVPLVLKFLFDDSIRSGEEIEKRLGMPVVGVIPMAADKSAKKGRAEE